MSARENWFEPDGKHRNGVLVVEYICVDIFGEPFHLITGPYFSWEDAQRACGDSETATIRYVNPPRVEA